MFKMSFFRWPAASFFWSAAASLTLQTNSAHADQLDILGISLGDEFALVEESMQSHFDGRDYDVYFLSSRSEYSSTFSTETIFSDGVLYVSDLRSDYSQTDVPFSEMLIVFFDDQSLGNPIIAVSRIIGLYHYSISVEDFELGMFDKYRQPGRIRRWSRGIGGIDYMWPSDPQLNEDLISEPRDWNFIRSFEENCAIEISTSEDFRPGIANEIWRNAENVALPVSFFFSSEGIHERASELWWLENSNSVGDGERTEIEQRFRDQREERRQCGGILLANTELWRLGGPGQRAIISLYDHNVIIDLFDRWQRESGEGSGPEGNKAPIDF